MAPTARSAGSRTVMLHRPGPELQAAHPAQQRQAALRRHPVGQPRPGRARRLRPGAARPRRRGALPHRAARPRRCRAEPRARARDRRRDGEPAPRRHAARPTSTGALHDQAPEELAAVPDRRRPQRRGARRARPGHQPAAARRLPDRPAAQPAVHPRLQRVDPRPGRDHLAGDAGARARDPADRADLHRAPALRRHARRSTAGSASTSRAATCCCSRPASSRSASASAPRPPARSGWPGRSSAPTSRTPCSPCPIAQERATMHLDTVCTMVDVDKIVMYPNVADSLQAYAVTVGRPQRRRRRATWCCRSRDAEPFLVAAAKAMSIDTLHQIDTGLDPVTAEREQWDDGNNTLASPRGSRWPTSATSRPTRGSRRPASRWSRSPAPSSAPGVAARAACPARSAATRCRRLSRAADAGWDERCRKWKPGRC